MVRFRMYVINVYCKYKRTRYVTGARLLNVVSFSLTRYTLNIDGRVYAFTLVLKGEDYNTRSNLVMIKNRSENASQHRQ